MSFLKPDVLPETAPRIAVIQTSEDENRFPLRYARALAALRRRFPGACVRDYTQYSSTCSGPCFGESLAALFADESPDGIAAAFFTLTWPIWLVDLPCEAALDTVFLPVDAAFGKKNKTSD